MKNVNHITVLFTSILFFLILLVLYNKTEKDIKEIKKEYNNIKKSSVEYQNLKNSFFIGSEVESKIKGIINRLNLKNASVILKDKKLFLKLNKFSLQKQEKLLNSLLNGRFIILNIHMEKDSLSVEIGLK